MGRGMLKKKSVLEATFMYEIIIFYLYITKSQIDLKNFN